MIEREEDTIPLAGLFHHRDPLLARGSGDENFDENKETQLSLGRTDYIFMKPVFSLNAALFRYVRKKFI